MDRNQATLRLHNVQNFELQNPVKNNGLYIKVSNSNERCRKILFKNSDLAMAHIEEDVANELFEELERWEYILTHFDFNRFEDGGPK